MLYLGIDLQHKALGVVEAETEEQAYYHFMRQAIYPANVIKLPEDVTTWARVADESCGCIRG